MKRAPLQFDTIACKACGAIVALLPPGALTHTTHLRCVHCQARRTVQIVDKPAARVYTDTQPAERPI